MTDKPTFEQTVKPDECALITERFARRLAFPLAKMAHRLGLSANAVTLMAGVSWMASLPLTPVAGYLLGRGYSAWGWGLALLCGTLWNIGYILDLADGSLARMTETACPSGFFLDYVFHLLFKPAFLASIGLAVYLAWPPQAATLWLPVLAILSIPANWSASSSAAEHVLCEETGKGRTNAALETDTGKRLRLWLGATDSHESALEKTLTPMRILRVVAQEVLSYYGQFSFFSLLVLLDFALAMAGFKPLLPLTAAAFALLSVFLGLRVPWRIARDFRRIRDGMDRARDA